MKIEEAHAQKGDICNSILRDLPEWFGIESAIQEYVKEADAKDKPMFVAKNKTDITGFLSLKIHNPFTAEIYVMGILKDYHRHGIGVELVNFAENYLKERNFQFLTVKTLSPSRESAAYQKTRLFYEKVGFLPLEEFPQVWGEHNPCLFMAKSIV